METFETRGYMLLRKLLLFLAFFFCSCLEHPKVSVIVPVHNRESMIGKCIHSIMKQTLKDIEIICVDDRSRDKSLNIINRLSRRDRRITVIRHKKNCGPACARNTGLKVAKGEYIGFVDSDDLVEPHAFETAYKKVKQGEYDVAAYGYWREKKKDYRGPSSEMVLLGKDAASFFFYGGGVPVVWNKLFKNELLKSNNISFDSSIRFWEDFLFNFDLVSAVHSVILINESLYRFNNTVRHNHRPVDLPAKLIPRLNRITENMKLKQWFSQNNINAMKSLAFKDSQNKKKKKKKKKVTKSRLN